MTETSLSFVRVLLFTLLTTVSTGASCNGLTGTAWPVADPDLRFPLLCVGNPAQNDLVCGKHNTPHHSSAPCSRSRFFFSSSQMSQIFSFIPRVSYLSLRISIEFFSPSAEALTIFTAYSS